MKSDASLLLSSLPEWGPTHYGVSVVIDEESRLDSLRGVLAMDVEDNEAGKFVGIGLYDGGKSVLYFTRITEALKAFLEAAQFVCQNGKYDLHQLRRWGVNVRAEQLVFDTMLASYVIDSTKESHGLKDNAVGLLGIEYPTYKEIVVSGRAKTTLDHQPIELVSAYNALDCICTHKLYVRYASGFSDAQYEYFHKLEMPVARLLFEMEQEGVQVSVEYLRELDVLFALEIQRLLTVIGRFVLRPSASPTGEPGGKANKRRKKEPKGFNVGSPKQVKDLLLRPNGVRVESTNKEALDAYQGVPLVQLLGRHRELAKLRGTYTQGLLSLDSLPRVHTTLNQVSYDAAGDSWGGIRSGRLSSSNPNLNNIPARTQTGNYLRRAFIPQVGHVFVDADYSQIEPRLMAHYSHDSRMMDIFRAGLDFYEGWTRYINRPRKMLKTYGMAKFYGAGLQKIAYILKCSESEAHDIDNTAQQVFSVFFGWKQDTERACAKRCYVETMFGRRIKLEDPRLAVPYLIQGSAAEILKQAMLDCTKAGYRPVLPIHDEMLFEAKPENAEKAAVDIKRIMESVATLNVPLIAEVGIGANWAEAKG
jgi:DNA polymerase-1